MDIYRCAFTSVSAVSVTGLSVITISDTFTTAGIIVLALILQLGGLGIMALGTLRGKDWFAKKKINYGRP